MSFGNSESLQRLISVSIKEECFFIIVIPIRNEAEYLVQTLKNLVNQVDLQNHPLDGKEFEIIFLVNNSNDDSAEIIRKWRETQRFPVVHLAEKTLAPEQSNIGYVRRWLMNEAYFRLKNNKFGGGIIATTDGDTTVAPNWIAATIKEIEKGADAVGGRILINSCELKNMNSKARSFHLRDTGYRLLAAEFEARLDYLPHDSMPRHYQHFNGSFAVTTGAFERAGGVPDVRCLEDVAFYNALLRIDARFRHSPAVRVQTSARSVGRTESGLSTQINEWTVMGQNGDEYLVEGAKAMSNRWQSRKNLRDLWQKSRRQKFVYEDDIKSLADKLLISLEDLKNELNEPQTFGVLYEKIMRRQHQTGEWNTENPLVPIEKAIFDLRLILEHSRREKVKCF